MSRIIITGAFRFPDGDAAAARVIGIAKALRVAGFSVKFAGWEDSPRKEDRQLDGSYSYQGFNYVSQSELREQKLSPLKRLFRYLLSGSNTLKWLKTTDLSDVSGVMVYHGGSIFLIRLALFCMRKKIPLFFDCTEWYNTAHLVGGRFGIVSIDNTIRMMLINYLIGNGVVISSYLERYYKARGCNVLRVPPLVDITDEKWLPKIVNIKSNEKEYLKLVYAGTPGKKDLLGNALRGLKILRQEGIMVQLHIIGPSQDAVLACIDNDYTLFDEIADMIVIHGRVPQSDVPQLVSSADFSILLRPQERYAQAGFSTKLVESLMVGVPIIANITGDIGGFITDNREGILIEEHSPQAFANGVKKAVDMSAKHRLLMRGYARQCAEDHFEYNKYVEPLCDFVCSLSSKKSKY